MRFALIVLVGVFSSQHAFPQTPPATSKAAPQSKKVLPTLLTKFVCKPICEKAGSEALAGDDLEQFNACANAQLCNEAHPPYVSYPMSPLEWLRMFEPSEKGS